MFKIMNTTVNGDGTIPRLEENHGTLGLGLFSGVAENGGIPRLAALRGEHLLLGIGQDSDELLGIQTRGHTIDITPLTERSVVQRDSPMARRTEPTSGGCQQNGPDIVCHRPESPDYPSYVVVYVTRDRWVQLVHILYLYTGATNSVYIYKAFSEKRKNKKEIKKKKEEPSAYQLPGRHLHLK
jgi:hypothetical protein